MTILIVWLHIAPIFNLPWWVQQMAIIAVPCFWTISSFLYFASFDFTSPLTSYKSKLLSRTRTVMVPFIVFNIFGLLFSLVLLQVHPVDYHPLEGVNAGNCLKALYHSKWNGALWYLRALFEFVLVAPLIGYVIRGYQMVDHSGNPDISDMSTRPIFQFSILDGKYIYRCFYCYLVRLAHRTLCTA